MSTAISASVRKAKEFRKRLRETAPGESVGKAVKIQKKEIAAEKTSGLTYHYKQSPKDAVPTTALTSSTTFDFEIKRSPGYKTKNGDSWYITFSCTNSDGTNSITPAFAEAFFDLHAGLEFLMNGRQICPPWSMMHIVLFNMEKATDISYTRNVTMMNHDKSLLNTSVTAIAASGTAKYRVRIPVPLPRNEPFWLGAIDGVFTIRVRTQTGGATVAGTGTLVLSSAELEIECTQVLDSEIPALEAEWAEKVWKVEESRLNEVASQVVASTGEYRFQLQALKDQAVTRILSFAHASRTSLTTATSYFLFLAPANTCKVHIQDKSGAQLFTSNTEDYGFIKYFKEPEQYGPDSPIPNTNLILNNCSPDLEEGQLTDKIDEVYFFDGDEYLTINNFGSNATTMFVDSLAFIESIFGIKKGNIYKQSA